MSNYPNPYVRNSPFDYTRPEIGTGTLGRFMNQVYAWMCVGLAVTAGVAYYVASHPTLMQSMLGPAVWAFLVVELILVMVISAAINRINANVATALFVLFAAINGLTLSSIFVVYKLPAIGSAFLVSAGMFGATSIYGMVTKRDLSGLGSLMFMGLIGIILASVVNFFLHSSGLGWAITYLGVVIFVGLTAYDTQKLKETAYQLEGNGALSNRIAIVGSLMLYLDFLNLFLFMLQIMGGAGGGDRRR